MKFSLFMTLLEFVPEKIRLTHKETLLGDYNGKEFFWSNVEVQNMEIEVIEVTHFDKKVILEVIK